VVDLKHRVHNIILISFDESLHASKEYVHNED
jgi:hypothetical protein